MSETEKNTEGKAYNIGGNEEVFYWKIIFNSTSYNI